MTFGVFGSACFVAYLWATYVVPETANVSLEMIDELFRSPASREDILVKRRVSAPLYELYDSQFLSDLLLSRWNGILDCTI
jgi:hypothetical protein